MCFGNEETVKTETESLPGWLTDAAQSNIGWATNLQNQGFTPYSGKMVADFSPQQSASFGLGTDIAGGVAPYVGQTGQLISSYAGAGPQSISAPTIASQMSPYMSQYVQQALQPQLQMQDVQFANQNKAVDSAATMAGAFGDTGWGQLRGTTTQAQDAARSGLIANAYNTAFNTAIGAGAQDVANSVNAQTTNANLAEQGLARQLTGANAFYNMGTGAANLTNTLGGQQTAQQQAGLNAQYNEFLRMMYQDPAFRAQIMNSAIGAGRSGAPVTKTTTAPDNSGWGMVGNIAGTAASALMFSDPKLKENIEQVGELYDGTPVHKFNFKGDPRTMIGLMATDVKKKTPEAVDESGPFKKVDYSMATRRAAKLARGGLEEQLGAAA